MNFPSNSEAQLLPSLFRVEVKPWTVNKVVACTPFKTRALQKVVRAGMALIDKKVELEELTVQFPTEDGRLQPGMKVFIRGDNSVHPWTREVFTLEGIEFILVPESVILAVKWVAPVQTVVSVTPDAAK